MVEQHTPSSERDPAAVHLSREIARNAQEHLTPPMNPGETKTLLPESEKPVRTFFRIFETPADRTETEPDLFSLHANEDGKWVLEYDKAEKPEEAWVIPDDVEFSIGSDGLKLRTLAEKQEEKPGRMVQAGGLPKAAQRLLAQALRGRGKTGDFGKITLISHASNKGSILSVRNAGGIALPLQTHELPEVSDEQPAGGTSVSESEVTQLEPPQETIEPAAGMADAVPSDSGESRIPEVSEKVAPEVPAEEVLPPEQTQEDASSQAEPEPVVESAPSLAPQRPGRTLDDFLGTTVYSNAEEEAPQQESGRITQRLGGTLDGERTPEEASGEADEEEAQPRVRERLILEEELTVPEAIERVTKHISEMLSVADKNAQETFREMISSLKRAIQPGVSIDASNAVEELNLLKKQTNGYSEEISQVREEIEKYLKAEDEVYAAKDRDQKRSEAEEELLRLRKEALDKMDELNKTLEKIDGANAEIVEEESLAISTLSSAPTGVNYDPATGVFNNGQEDAKMTAIREAVLGTIDRVRAMEQSLQERSRGHTDASQLVEELETLQNRFKERSEG